MTKFTPGPLAIAGPSTSGVGLKNDGGDYAITDSAGNIVGEAFRKVAEATDAPAKENALLWSAAPDLYEALELLAEEIKDLAWANDDSIIKNKIDDAFAALAKARGES